MNVKHKSHRRTRYGSLSLLKDIELELFLRFYLARRLTHEKNNLLRHGTVSAHCNHSLRFLLFLLIPQKLIWYYHRFPFFISSIFRFSIKWDHIMVIMVGYEKRFLNILSFIIQTQKSCFFGCCCCYWSRGKKIYDAKECIIAILHTEADSH